MRYLSNLINICIFAKIKTISLRTMNNITIPNRINWIDWAKVIAISLVVFGHIPMISGNFPQKYITNFHMPLFFLISGYLTKKECFNTNTIKKYWHTLIIPYIFYNIIFYPYWIVRHFADAPNIIPFDFIKPIIGTFFLQLRTPISDPLNEVTWFVAVLIVMKLVLSVVNLHKRSVAIMFLLSIICALFYIYNRQYRICENLPIIGFFRCMPFFYIGHLCNQRNVIPLRPTSQDWYICFIGIGLSLFSYKYLIQYSPTLIIHALIYASASIAIIGTISLCRLLDKIHSTIIENLSIGTIVIMGLHWMLIGTTNFVLQKLLHIDGGITYSLSITIMLTILYETFLYPVILIIRDKYPFLLGKNLASRK